MQPCMAPRHRSNEARTEVGSYAHQSYFAQMINKLDDDVIATDGLNLLLMSSLLMNEPQDERPFPSMSLTHTKA